jgi:hypothetical protein
MRARRTCERINDAKSGSSQGRVAQTPVLFNNYSGLSFATDGNRSARRAASASMPSINARTDTTSLIGEVLQLGGIGAARHRILVG